MRNVSILLLVVFWATMAIAQVPQIAATSPTQTELNVSVDANISVSFDIDIDETTINNSTIKVNASISGLHQGTITYDSPSKTATFDPDNDFESGEIVTVTLNENIESAGGTPLDNSYIWSFSVVTGYGPAKFSSRNLYSALTSVHDVCAADFNGDGYVDLAASSRGWIGIAMLLNRGDGSFSLPLEYPSDWRPVHLTAADVDQDNDIDLVAALNDDGEVSVYLNNGDGTLADYVTYPAGSGANAVCAADLDGDGDIDLGVANYEADSISVLLNNGDGTYTWNADYAAGHQPTGIVTCDLDGDADLDLAVSDRSWNTTRVISTFMNNGDGTFGPQTTYPAAGYPAAIACGDLDSDGDPDLVVTKGESSEAVLIYLNDGDGTFSGYTEIITGRTPRPVVVNDLNGDGHLDIATTNYWNATCSILLNNGDGTMGTHSEFNIAGALYSMTSADFDNDNDIDLAFGSHDYQEAIVLLNDNEIKVTNLDDAGEGSLRWVIETAVADTSIRNIVFDVSGTIEVMSPLPPIGGYGHIAIRGYSAPDPWHGQTITLDGSNLIASGNGLEFHSPGNLVNWIKIHGFPENGIAVYGETSHGNSFTQNLIFDNGLLGIDLGGDGVTINDPGDIDNGPNEFFNYPVFDSSFMINDTTFSVYGSAAVGSRIELYRDNNLDPSGHGEGLEYLNYYESKYVDESGIFSFNGIYYYPWSPEFFDYVTALATDSNGNTSEFAENLTLINPIEFNAYSPVNLWITDPNGDYIGKDASGTLFQTLETAEYHEDLPDENDKIIINRPILGMYTIEVITEDGAAPEAKYSVGSKILYSWECMLSVNAAVPATATKDTLNYTVESGWYYKNGDADRNNEINVLDITFIINYIYKGGPTPYPQMAADANCNLTVNLLDITYLINYLYKSGPVPCDRAK